MTTIEQEYTHLPIGELKPHPQNPRKGDIRLIAESIKANGFYGSVVVQKSTGYVLAGWHRSRAAEAAGMSEVPVMVVDCDDAQAKRILAVDNRANQLATFDNEALLALLQDISGDADNLLGTGFTNDDLADLLAQGEAEWTPNEVEHEPAGKSEFGASIGERQAMDRRLMVLDMPVDRYLWLVDALEVVCEEEGVESNVAAVLALVAKRTGQQVPREGDGLDEDEDA